jgi:hypothetical protein
VLFEKRSYHSGCPGRDKSAALASQLPGFSPVPRRQGLGRIKHFFDQHFTGQPDGMLYHSHIIGIQVNPIRIFDIQPAHDHMLCKPDALVFQKDSGTGMVTSVNDHDLCGIRCRLDKAAGAGGDTGQAEHAAGSFFCQLPGGPVGKLALTGAPGTCQYHHFRLVTSAIFIHDRVSYKSLKWNILLYKLFVNLLNEKL